MQDLLISQVVAPANAATLLGVDKAEMQRMILAGEVPTARLADGTVVVPVVEVNGTRHVGQPSVKAHGRRPRQAQVPVQTIELTAKRHKAGMLVGALMIVAGVFLLLAGQGEWACAGLGFGLLLLLVSRMNAWWEHG